MSIRTGGLAVEEDAERVADEDGTGLTLPVP
jgi:hypothetical protein